jgi:hypothetical protein
LDLDYTPAIVFVKEPKSAKAPGVQWSSSKISARAVLRGEGLADVLLLTLPAAGHSQKVYRL